MAEQDDEPKIDLPLIMPDDVAEAAAAAPAFAEEELPPPFAAAQRTPAPPTPPPAAVALSDDDGAADTAALSGVEPVLTETMAELYLRQGHQEDALRVYQALLAQRPTDARLRGRVESLAGGGAIDLGHVTWAAVHGFLQRILACPPGNPSSPPPWPPTRLPPHFH